VIAGACRSRMILHDRRTAGRLSAVLRVSPWSRCAPPVFCGRKGISASWGVILGDQPGGLCPGRRVGPAVHHPEGPRGPFKIARGFAGRYPWPASCFPAAISRRTGRAHIKPSFSLVLAAESLPTKSGGLFPGSREKKSANYKPRYFP
jgi:hypothetical protein